VKLNATNLRGIARGATGRLKLPGLRSQNFIPGNLLFRSLEGMNSGLGES